MAMSVATLLAWCLVEVGKSGSTAPEWHRARPPSISTFSSSVLISPARSRNSIRALWRTFLQWLILVGYFGHLIQAAYRAF